MAHYAIMRLAKVKTMGHVAGLGHHVERERETRNADGDSRAGEQIGNIASCVHAVHRGDGDPVKSAFVQYGPHNRSFAEFQYVGRDCVLLQLQIRGRQNCTYADHQ